LASNCHNHTDIVGKRNPIETLSARQTHNPANLIGASYPNNQQK